VTERAAPYYCPYCGDEDLRPYGERHGAWWCASCRRAWTLGYLGTGTPDADGSDLSPSGKDPAG
jgi:ribosomal protein L37AE/L43A